MNKLIVPKNEAELLARCQQLSGNTLGELASAYQQTIPKSLHQDKGFSGLLLERALGATAQNAPEPDFPHLGIELKTLPLNQKGQPRESTYVCTAPISLDSEVEHWRTSRVYKKLSRVLWVPIEADPKIPIANRRIGTPLLWSPNSQIEAILQQDWEELTHMLYLGNVEKLSAKIGIYLQIRPKAAHSRILNRGFNEQGEEIWINPKGFYLRTRLTQQILDTCYCQA